MDQAIKEKTIKRNCTSPTSGCLNILGYGVGKNIMPANKFNERGYFENNSLYHFNEDLLIILYVCWYDTLYLSEDWLDCKRISELRPKLNEIEFPFKAFSSNTLRFSIEKRNEKEFKLHKKIDHLKTENKGLIIKNECSELLNQQIDQLKKRH